MTNDYQPNEDSNDKCPNGTFKSLLGEILYASKVIPSIGFSITTLASVTAPNRSDYSALLRVLKYLKGAKKQIDVYKPDNLNITQFTDISFATTKDRKSVGCAYIYIGGNLTHFYSKKQNMISKSTTIAEMLELDRATTTSLWIRNMLIHMKLLNANSPIISFLDCQPTLDLLNGVSINPVNKHHAIRIEWLRNLMADGILKVYKIATGDQLADLGTKVLPAQSFNRMLSIITNPKMVTKHIHTTTDASPEPKLHPFHQHDLNILARRRDSNKNGQMDEN